MALGCFQFLSIMNRIAINSLIQEFFVAPLLFFGFSWVNTQWKNCWVVGKYMLNYKETAKYFSKIVVPSYSMLSEHAVSSDWGGSPDIFCIVNSFLSFNSQPKHQLLCENFKRVFNTHLGCHFVLLFPLHFGHPTPPPLPTSPPLYGNQE